MKSIHTTTTACDEEVVLPEEMVKERLDQFHHSWVSEIDDEVGDVRQIHTYIDEDFHIEA